MATVKENVKEELKKEATTDKEKESTVLAESSEVKSILKNHVYLSAGMGLVPIPIVDMAGLTAIQIDMIYKQVKIISNQPVGCGCAHLLLECPEVCRAAVPGQFVMLGLIAEQAPLLARPFSIHQLHHHQGHPLDHLDSPLCQRLHLERVVGEQADSTMIRA